MIPPNVHNSLTTDSQDIKLNDILVKKFKIIFYYTITELQENGRKTTEWIKEDNRRCERRQSFEKRLKQMLEKKSSMNQILKT